MGDKQKLGQEENASYSTKYFSIPEIPRIKQLYIVSRKGKQFTVAGAQLQREKKRKRGDLESCTP